MDRVYLVLSFALYGVVGWRLYRWGWWRFLPIFSLFVAENIASELILYGIPYGSQTYFYAYCIDKALQIILGLLAVIELSRVGDVLVAYTLASYFAMQFAVLSLGREHWHSLDILTQPLMIVFQLMWAFHFDRLRSKGEQIRARTPRL